jgi:hypothetical protein
MGILVGAITLGVSALSYTPADTTWQKRVFTTFSFIQTGHAPGFRAA